MGHLSKAERRVHLEGLLPSPEIGRLPCVLCGVRRETGLAELENRDTGQVEIHRVCGECVSDMEGAPG